MARSPFALVVKSSSLSAAQTVVSVAGAKRLAPVIVKDGKRIAAGVAFAIFRTLGGGGASLMSANETTH